MSNSPAFDLSPMIAGVQYTGLATEVLLNSLSRSIQFDGHSGSVSIDTIAVVHAAERGLSERLLVPFVSALNDVASGGMAVFGSPEEIDRGTALAIPWTVISDLVYRLQGTPVALRSALGIDGATSADEAVSLLRRNFPNVPEWMIAGKAAERLIQNPVAIPGDGWEPEEREAPDDKPPKPGGHKEPKEAWDGFIAPAVNDALDVARCLVQGRGGPAFGHWWGWTYGFEVCLDQACAAKLAKLLTGLGGGSALLKALKDVVSASTISAGIKALQITAGMAIAIYGFLLGVNILAVNWAKGVCLRFNWPVIGGPGMFVIAFAGA